MSCAAAHADAEESFAYQVVPGLYLRAGVVYELRGAWGKSVGIGFMPAKNVSIDVALQRDMFPELGPEFGRAALANPSMSIAF